MSKEEAKKSFRSLSNYKSMQADVARKKGVLPELLAATTLTESRKIVFGTKPKQRRGR